ncbi:MAG: fasciclin domain-containing protein [Bacteroidota bacterium]
MTRSLLLVAALVVATGCASTNDDMMAASAPTQNLVETAISAELNTLVAAVQAAELVETLSGPGPFTVFAPTDAAFAGLPEGTVETLLMPENQGQLQGVLTFHVVAGQLAAADLSDGQTLTTVNGETLTVSISGGSVMIGNDNGMATVALADVFASNGVAHVIDGVLLP